ncbi:YcaO-like family protein [Haloprofundus salilacus]|uniref:YcaO-like family protein n=1 Tax=Haloprofundus salilacus TaxID=2876190 RepID=UPI001CCC9D7F|nr:YcaO-like family protein [Haloprofundus salilacus]
MHAGLVGSGPAAESVRAAFADIDAQVSETTPGGLADFALGVVVAPAGSDAFAQANDVANRWVAVEIGGVGGHPLSALDASVSVFAADSGCFRCLRARVASNLDDDEAADRPHGDRAAVRLAGAVAGRRAVALLSSESLAGTVVEVPGPEREFHPVPGCECHASGPSNAARDQTFALDHRDADLDDSLARAERALDDRVGIVRTVGERESFPVPYYFAQTADTTVFSDARAAEFAAGVDADWNPAFMKALGEALERYCAGVYRNGEFVTASETNRANPVSPRRFVRPDGWETAGRDESIPWAEGVDLDSRERVSLPAEFVQFPPPTERHKPAITTGLGLGNSTVEACLSGLYETLERDATMLAWYSTFDPLELVVDDEGFETLVGRARAESLSVTPLLVTQDVDVPVVAVAVHRGGEIEEATWPQFAVGSGANLDAAAAARSALAEALQNWTELRAMGPERAAGESGAIGEYADFPRAARRFVDSTGRVRAADVGTAELSGTEELETVVSRASAAGLGTYAARVTTPDVAALGFEAVRVVVPEAQPLFTGEAFFGERARRVPADLGFEPRLDAPFHPYP